MADLIETTTDQVRDAATHTVFVKQRWADEWEEQPGLYCDYYTLVASPEIATAGFSWRFGFGMNPGELSQEEKLPKSLDNWYVLVEVEFPGRGLGSFRWYGIILSDARQYDGDVAANDAVHANGTQRLSAFGLEYLLMRTLVETSVVEANETNNQAEIGRALIFNGGAGQTLNNTRLVGNRSNELSDTDNVYQFARTLATASQWSADEIVDYLLKYHLAKNPAGETAIQFTVDLNLSSVALNWQTPVLTAHGRTVKDLLDELIDRRQFLGYYVETEGLLDTHPVIKIFSFNQETITFDDERQINANPNQVILDYSAAVDVIDALTIYETTEQYDQVVVIGAQRTSTFSLGYAWNTLDKSWTDDQETDFLTGYTAPDAATDIEKQAFRNQYRNRDALRPVYQWFQIQDDWSGYATTSEGPIYAVSPLQTLDDTDLPTADFDDLEPFMQDGLRFQRQLPLLEGWDYRDDSIVIGDYTAEHRRPFAVVLVNADDVSTNAVDSYYEYVDVLNGDLADNDEEVDSATVYPSYVRVLGDRPGVEIRPTGVRWQYGGDDFNADASGRDPADEITGLLNWQDVIVTVSCKWDSFLRAEYPADVSDLETDYIRKLRVYAPELRLDFIAEDTVVEIENGELVRSGAKYANDDRLEAERLARMTYEWFGTKRQRFSLTYRQVDPQFSPGMLVTEVGSETLREEVNSVITSVRWDLVRQTTTIQTDYANIDFRAFG